MIPPRSRANAPRWWWGLGLSLALQAQVAAESRLPVGVLSPQVPQPSFNRGDRGDATPQGLDLGAGITARPKLDVAALYDDNVFRVQRGAKADGATVAVVDLSLERPDEVTAFGLTLRSKGARYGTFRSEDYVEYSLGAQASTKLGDLTLGLSGGGERVLEERGSTETFRTGTGAVLFDRRRAGAEALYQGAVLTGYAGFVYDDYVYGTTGGVDNRDRDRGEIIGTLRLGYDLTDVTNLFIQADVNDRRYTRLSYDGFDRTSNGYRVGLGFHYELSDITFLDLYGGWLSQDYRDRRFTKVDGPAARASLGWHPTDLILISLNGERRLDESDLVGVAGITTSALDLRLALDVTADLTAGLTGGFVRQAFEVLPGTPKLGEDQAYRYGVDARRLFGPHFEGYVGWVGFQRLSQRPGLTYRSNQVTLGVTSQW